MENTPYIYEYCNNLLGVQARYIFSGRNAHADSLCLIGYTGFNKRIEKGYITRLRAQAPNTPMLVEFSTLPYEWQNLLKRSFGKAKEQARQSLFALDIASKVLPVIQGLLEPIANVAQTIADWFKAINTESGGWADWLSIVSDYLFGHLVPLLSKIFNTVVHIVKKIIEFVKSSELLKDYFRVLSTIFGFLLDVVSFVVDALKWVFDNVVMPILKAIEWAYKLIKGAAGFKVTSEQNSDGTVTFKAAKPTMPDTTTQTNTDLLKDISKNTATNNAAAQDAAGATASGGPKVVNITIQKLFDNININTATLKEGANEIEQIVMETFARIITQGAQTA